MIRSILIDGDVAGYQLEYWKINVQQSIPSQITIHYDRFPFMEKIFYS